MNTSSENKTLTYMVHITSILYLGIGTRNAGKAGEGNPFRESAE